MEYGISRYLFAHMAFKTQDYFGVYRYSNETGENIDIAHFGTREDAERYVEWKENGNVCSICGGTVW